MLGEVRNLWLPRLGSNQGFQLQRLTCYHYTTGQRSGPMPIRRFAGAGVAHIGWPTYILRCPQESVKGDAHRASKFRRHLPLAPQYHTRLRLI